MISIQPKIHDKFSIELKIVYWIKNFSGDSDFTISSWLFIPESLDLGRDSYKKELFYRDIKSNVRLITPVYSLEEICKEDSLPFMFLEGAVNEVVMAPSESNAVEFEHQIKMFGTIYRSALRNAGDAVLRGDVGNKRNIYLFLGRIDRIIGRFRDLEKPLKEHEVSKQVLNYFAFCDEFISLFTENYIFEVILGLEKKHPFVFKDFRRSLIKKLEEETAYRKRKGYETADKDSRDKNIKFVYRMGMLKKYMDSQLFLDSHRKEDGFLARQFYYSLAAGFSMIVATVISFSFQQKYGNFTMPLFVALVVGYMLKDRIKDLGRFIFSSKLSRRYFDTKRIIGIKNNTVGYIKDAVDFIPDSGVPEEVMKLRNRSDLFEMTKEAREDILLHRKFVKIDGKILDKINQYDIAGIHEIMRFNFSRFTQKMDDVEIGIPVPEGEDSFVFLQAEKIYYLNFVMRLQCGNEITYRRYRLTICQEGIRKLEQMN